MGQGNSLLTVKLLSDLPNLCWGMKRVQQDLIFVRKLLPKEFIMIICL